MIESEHPSSRRIIGVIITCLLIPSYFCFGFIFYNCIRISQLRKSRRNRVILTLLVFLFVQALFEVPCRLYYLYNDQVPIRSEIFCQIWHLIYIIINIIDLHLMLLASIERYLLVFHHEFLTKYYISMSIIPILISIIYPTLWYLIGLYSPNACRYIPNYSLVQCGIPCYLTTSMFYISFIIYIHHLLPIIATTCVNIYLIIKVLKQKTKMKQNNLWRKNLRMTIQLLSISFLYLIVWLPHCILASFPLFTTGQTATKGRFLQTEYFENFLSFFVCLCPFIALTGFTQLNNKIKQIIFFS